MFNQSKPKYIFVFIGLVIFFISQCILSSKGQSSEDSSFTMQKSVVAGGGDSSTGNGFTLTGTVGQSIAGVNSQGSPFSLQSGFWASDFAPTAAEVTLGGQVTNIDGLGLSKVKITLVDVFTNETRTTYTDAKGNYHFTDVAVGTLYIITAERERYNFTPSQQIINLSGDEKPVNFTATHN